MIQTSRPMPPGSHLCAPSHRPQLVQTRGAPAGHRIGSPRPPQWHVECAQCVIATTPVFNPADALRAWRGKPDLFHIPLSQLDRVRLHVVNAVAAA